VRAEEFTLSQGKDLSSWPIVQRVLAGEVDQLGDKHAEVLPGPAGHLLWIGGPARDEEGLVGGILVGIYLDDLARALTEKAVARVSLFDEEGRGLASALFDEPRQMSVAEEFRGKLRSSPQSALLEPLEWEDRQYLVGYAPLTIRGKDVGILSAAVSTEHLAQSNLRARTGMIGLFSLAGLAVLLLGYLIAGHITSPLRRLVTTSRHIAAGDLTQRVERIGRDEIGQLARAFNLMAEELEKHIDQLSQRITELTVLYQTGTQLSKTLDLAEILEMAVDALYGSGEVNLVVLLLRSEVDEGWSWAAARGVTRVRRQAFLASGVEALPSGLLSLTHGDKPVIFHEQGEIETVRAEIGLDAEVGSLIVIPLTSPEQIVGLVFLGKTEKLGFSDDAQLRLLHTISTQIARSIQNARLHAQVRENVYRLATLHRASRSISAKLSQDEVLEHTLSSVVEISQANLVAISLWDPVSKRLELGAYSGFARATEGGDWPGRKMAEHAVLDRHPFTTQDNALVPVSTGGTTLALGDSLCVPMVAEGQVMGAVFVERAHPDDRFLSSDLEALNTVATQAALAVKNALLYEDIRSLYRNVVKSLAAAIDARDAYTHGHSHRVAVNSLVVADYLGLQLKQRKALEIAGYLHDIGKIGVPDAILLKTGPLTSDETQSLEEHPALGASILEPVGFDEEVISIVLSHHERIDGRGYPLGLKGNDIPLGARIMHVVDSFDAMVSTRPYRSGLLVEAALRELHADAGTQFDPEVVHEFTAAFLEDAIMLPAGAACKETEPTEATLTFKALGR